MTESFLFFSLSIPECPEHSSSPHGFFWPSCFLTRSITFWVRISDIFRFLGSLSLFWGHFHGFFLAGGRSGHDLALPGTPSIPPLGGKGKGLVPPKQTNRLVIRATPG